MAGLLLEFAPGRNFHVDFVRTRLALGNGPVSGIGPPEEGATRVGQKNLDEPAAHAVEKYPGASSTAHRQRVREAADVVPEPMSLLAAEWRGPVSFSEGCERPE